MNFELRWGLFKESLHYLGLEVGLGGAAALITTYLISAVFI